MAYNAAFTITSLIIPGSFTLTDTSTGSDPNITDRTIQLVQADGSLLTGAPIDFPLSAGNSITLNVLNVDYCLTIIMTTQSTSPLPPPSTYQYSGLFLFTGNTQQFLNELVGSAAMNYTVIQDTYFYENTSRVQTDKDNANNAVLTMQQLAAQSALNRAQFFITNKPTFF